MNRQFLHAYFLIFVFVVCSFNKMSSRAKSRDLSYTDSSISAIMTAKIKDNSLGKNISEKTVQDLEFPTVLQHVAEYCISELGKTNVLNIKPIENTELLLQELNLVNEYLS